MAQLPPFASADAFIPSTTAVGHSLVLSALAALIPLAVFFVLLGAVKVRAHLAGLGALVAALAVAVLGFRMPAGMGLLSATEGAVYGLFPIMFIVVCAVWVYQLTVVSGRFEDLREVFNVVGKGDIRIQAMLIAFCFGGLLEALAGFGAPVAITATMVVALGLPPLRAAATVLVANTAPVAFGAMAIPITTAGRLTNIDPTVIGALVGRQTPLLSWFIPVLLLFVIDGRRGLREAWPVALVTGVAFALAKFVTSNFFDYTLTDMVASLVGLGVAIAFLRVWSPAGGSSKDGAAAGVPASSATTAGSGGTAVLAAQRTTTLSRPRVVLALMPYVVIVVVFALAKLVPAVRSAVESTDLPVHWPGLYGHLLTSTGQPAGSTVYTLPWLSNPGTLLLVCGAIVALAYRRWDDGGRFALSLRDAARTFGRTIVDMRMSILTVAIVLALGYVMNQSGQTVAIGTWFAATGTAFALISPVLGWLGTAVTGSDTSANALFANLQQSAAQTIHHAAVAGGHTPVLGSDQLQNLLVSSGSSGGTVGKLVSPQNLSIAASAIRQPGSESAIMKSVLGYCAGLLGLLCLISFLMNTPVLAWVVP